jgi:hypothetical protein
VNSDAGKPHRNFEGHPRLRQALDSIASRLAGEVSKINASAGVTLEVS